MNYFLLEQRNPKKLIDKILNLIYIKKGTGEINLNPLLGNLHVDNEKEMVYKYIYPWVCGGLTMKQLNDLQTVYDCLGNWWGQIHTRNDQGLYDINRESEDAAAGLLNLVFDLGDDKNKIASQVTSRTDTAKIKKDLDTFMKTHQGRFSGGIRFLILSDEKPRISKEECREICPGFDPGVDILNFRDFLEKEFGPLRSKAEDPIKILGKGSKKFYNALRGPNGRFRYLSISEIILPGTRTQWLETNVETEPAGKREDFILNRIAADYTENALTPDQVKKAMKTPAPGKKNVVPSMVLLLDGFNEITVEKRELHLELNHLTEQCPGI